MNYCFSCMHGRKRDFKLAVRGPSTRHLPSTRSHSTTVGLSLVPKSTALHRTRTQTLPANVRCLQEPWRLVSGRRTMCDQLFLHPATRVSRLRTNPNSMTSESQPQDIWCQNDRTLRSWSRPTLPHPLIWRGFTFGTTRSTQSSRATGALSCGISRGGSGRFEGMRSPPLV